ncbi:MAG: choice-of-anchor tandem repeat GloVer-containing protein [Bryobacteraceae bacterium]
MAASPAQTAVEIVRHSFSGPPNGSWPQAGVIRDAAGNLYGTTQLGGTMNAGVVYKLDTANHATVLYSFTGGVDGGTPYGNLTADPTGNLYGTTYSGGAANLGVVFKVDPTGHETVLYSFEGSPDGSWPLAGVVFDSEGNLFGTTYGGGTANSGTIYKLDLSGHETVLYSFTGGADGGFPFGGIAIDPAGNLYGTTYVGGSVASFGVVYKLDTAGEQTVLHGFTDGILPRSGVTLDSAGNLYGTTSIGGASNQGTVYKLDTTGQFAILHSFAGGFGDGSVPNAGVILDSSGNLYGTTSDGGSWGSGTVYKLDTAGHETVIGSIDGSPQAGGLTLDSDGNLYGTTLAGGSAKLGTIYKFDAAGHQSVLYNFPPDPKGTTPIGVILDRDGNFYGPTQQGGIANAGVVYKVDATGKQTVLYNFTGGTDGGGPMAGLIRDSAGNLLGTTNSGGTGLGVVYKLDNAGNQTVLHTFQVWSDGYSPNGGLIQDSTGNLYGTTSQGGLGYGVVYKLDPAGNYAVLYSFTGGPDGSQPDGGVILDSAGNLYGATFLGGLHNYGVVFKLDSAGNQTVLYSFTGVTDGRFPIDGVTLDASGNIYGITSGGGTYEHGVVYKLDTTGRLTVLYTFTGLGDGNGPNGGVVLDSAGNLYGTSQVGGTAGLGMVYKLDPAGQLTVLYNFLGTTDGSLPSAGVILDAAGNLYGTTSAGAPGGGGVVYKLVTGGHATTLQCAPETGPALIGVPYNTTCTVSGGTEPYSWSISPGTLPPGIVLSPSGSTATITGSPTQLGPYNYTLTVTDSGIPQSITKPFSGNIGSSLDISCESAAGPIVVGVPYHTTCKVAGGAPPYAFSVTPGSLPPGLAFTVSGGVATITGTPTIAGAYNYAVTVTDSSGAHSITKSFSGAIASKLELSCAPMTDPAVVGVPYRASCTASAGIAPYAWSISSGTLPPGINFTSSGNIATVAGTPATPGTYSFTVKVTNGGDSPETLTSSNVITVVAATLAVPTAPLTFNYTVGGATPVAQPVSVSGTSGILFTASPGQNSWLSVTPSGMVPGTLSIRVNPAGLAAGTYTGSITVVSTGVTGSPFIIPVTVNVAAGTLAVSPGLLSFSYQPGDVVTPQTTHIATGSVATSFAIIVPPGCEWLSLSALTGTTPADVAVSAKASALTAGAHNCALAVTVPGESRTMLVAFSVSGPALRLDPPNNPVLRYTMGDPAPASKTLKLSSNSTSEGVPFHLSYACPWLSITPLSGLTAASLTVAVNTAGLAAGTYSCPISITAVSASAIPQLTVTLAVASPTISTAPAALSLNARQGSTTAVLRNLSVSGPATATDLTVTASGGGWLAVANSAGKTPANITVMANPSGLSAGTYEGSISVNSAAGSKQVPVTLVVSSRVVSAVPAEMTFHIVSGAPAASQVLSVITSDGAAVPLTATATGPLTVTPIAGSANFRVAVNPAGLPVGLSTGTVVVTASGSSTPIQVAVQVMVDPQPGATPVLSLYPTDLALAAVAGGPAVTGAVLVNNTGGGTLSVTATTATIAGGPWLSVVSGTAVLSVVADPSDLLPGTYRGEVVVSTSDASIVQRIPVTLSVAALPGILLSRAALSFTAVKGANGTLPQIVDVSGGNRAKINWTAAMQTLSGGGWLKTTPSAGALDPLSVSVDTSNLSAGTYYGTVAVSAAGTANLQQSVSVQLTVLESDGHLSPVITPAGLLFTGTSGAGGLATQNVSIFSPTGGLAAYSSAVVTDDQGTWCSLLPGPSVQVDFSKFAAGKHQCAVRLLFEDGSVSTVTAVALATISNAAASCTTLSGVSIKAPGDGFVIQSSQSTPIEIEVRDNCGQPADGAAVIASFSSHGQVTLTSVGNGIYRGNWSATGLPENIAQLPVILNVTAEPGGSAQISGTLLADQIAITQIAAAVDGAGFQKTLSPGSWISIFGNNLADSTEYKPGSPLSTVLVGSKALLAGQELPLLYVSENQVNAQIPYGVPTNTPLQLLMVRGNTVSVPQLVPMASAKPGIFTLNSQGSGQGAIFANTTDGKRYVADGTNRAGQGDVIEIYAAGLGAIDAAGLPGGTAAPTDTLVRVTAPDLKVTFGGVTATDIRFAGLAPGYIGLYQVNAVLPAGVQPGPAVSVVISVAGQVSQDGVTIGVK